MPGITIYYGDAGSGKTSAIIKQFNKDVDAAFLSPRYSHIESRLINEKETYHIKPPFQFLKSLEHSCPEADKHIEEIGVLRNLNISSKDIHDNFLPIHEQCEYSDQQDKLDEKKGEDPKVVETIARWQFSASSHHSKVYVDEPDELFNEEIFFDEETANKIRATEVTPNLDIIERVVIKELKKSSEPLDFVDKDYTWYYVNPAKLDKWQKKAEKLIEGITDIDKLREIYRKNKQLFVKIQVGKAELFRDYNEDRTYSGEVIKTTGIKLISGIYGALKKIIKDKGSLIVSSATLQYDQYKKSRFELALKFAKITILLDNSDDVASIDLTPYRTPIYKLIPTEKVTTVYWYGYTDKHSYSLNRLDKQLNPELPEKNEELETDEKYEHRINYLKGKEIIDITRNIQFTINRWVQDYNKGYEANSIALIVPKDLEIALKDKKQNNNYIFPRRTYTFYHYGDVNGLNLQNDHDLIVEYLDFLGGSIEEDEIRKYSTSNNKGFSLKKNTPREVRERVWPTIMGNFVQAALRSRGFIPVIFVGNMPRLGGDEDKEIIANELRNRHINLIPGEESKS